MAVTSSVTSSAASSTTRYTAGHSHPIALFNGHSKASLNGHTHPVSSGHAPTLKGASKDFSQVSRVISSQCHVTTVSTEQVNRQPTPAISTQSYRTAVPRPLDLLMTWAFRSKSIYRSTFFIWLYYQFYTIYLYKNTLLCTDNVSDYYIYLFKCRVDGIVIIIVHRIVDILYEWG